MPHIQGNRMPNMSREVHGTRSIHPFMLLNRIGAGGYGAVYRARYLAEPRETGIFACKAMAKGPPGSILEHLHVREINHHRRVTNHPNIANFHGFFSQNPDYLYLFMEYYHTGSLFRIIAKTHILGRNDALVRRLFLQILSAVQFCHKKGIYHRDLKPENILVNEDCTEAFLTDFGLSTQSKHSKTFRVGSRHYMSPECINANGAFTSYDTKRSDIWALGIILLNMITGRCPWTEASPKDPNFVNYMRTPGWLRKSFPISQGADGILRRIFTSQSSKTIEIDELCVLIEQVDTFYMSKKEITRGSSVLRKNSEYLYRRPQPVAPPAPPPSEGLPLWVLPPTEWEGDVLASDTESEPTDSATNSDADWEDSVPGVRIRRIIPIITDPELHDGQVGWRRDKTPAAHLEHPELRQQGPATEPPSPIAAAAALPSSGRSPIPALRIPATVLAAPAPLPEEESSLDFSPNVRGKVQHRGRGSPETAPSTSSSNAQDTGSSDDSSTGRRGPLRRRSERRVRTIDHEIVDPMTSHPWSRLATRMRRLLGGRMH
ncbi:Pkinase-domain-containing protein [Panus rudis PR-1116 ss-1]|nr:Pkinase-domain-containing protein [Panus rudis PR-1116 ss-1]